MTDADYEWLVYEAKVDLHDGLACRWCGTPARPTDRPLGPRRDPDPERRSKEIIPRLRKKAPKENHKEGQGFYGKKAR